MHIYQRKLWGMVEGWGLVAAGLSNVSRILMEDTREPDRLVIYIIIFGAAVLWILKPQRPIYLWFQAVLSIHDTNTSLSVYKESALTHWSSISSHFRISLINRFLFWMKQALNTYDEHIWSWLDVREPEYCKKPFFFLHKRFRIIAIIRNSSAFNDPPVFLVKYKK